MSTTWPTFDGSDFVSGQDATRQTPQGIWNRIICAMCCGTHIHVEGNTSSGSFTPIYDFNWAAPLACKMDTTFYMMLYVHATPSGGNGFMRLAQGTNYGSTVTATATDFYEMTLEIQSSFIDTNKSYDVEAKTNGSAITLDVDNLTVNLRVYD